MFLLWLRQLPSSGARTPALVSSPTKGRSSPTNTLVFPPSSFILPSFVWVYIFFSAGQALLSTLSWCSACTSLSEGVLLMYLWREMYSMPTYSSTIFFSPSSFFLLFLCDLSSFICWSSAACRDLNPVLQTRVYGPKWLHRHLTSVGMCAEATYNTQFW